MREGVFFGRSEEQSRMRELLTRMDQPSGVDDRLSHVVVVYGRGGIGKTRLLQRFHEIVHEGDSGVVDLWIDWEMEREARPAEFAHGRDHAPAMLRTIEHAVTSAPGLEDATGEGVTRARAALHAAWEGRASLGEPVGAPLVAPTLQPPSESVDLSGYLGQGALAGLTRHDPVIIALGSLLRALSGGQPLVLFLDTSEIVSDDRRILIELARRSGPRVAFVIALRAEEGGSVTEDPVVTAFSRHIPERMRRLMELHRFDDATVGEYLARHLPTPPSADLVAEVAAVTRGIPLAVSLVTPLLMAGVPSAEVLEPITRDGAPSEVIRQIAERFLLHVREDPSLHTDERLLFGLASVYGEHAETDVLEALWDAKGALASTMDGLARRHDFVLSSTRRLHADVKDVFLRYLQEPTRRADMADAHRRAIHVVMERLARLRDQASTTEELVRLEEWGKWSTFLLWHRFWTGNEDGMQLLYELYTVALRHRPSLLAQYRSIASWFEPTMNSTERATLRGLRSITHSPFYSALVANLGEDRSERRRRLVREAQAALDRLRSHRMVHLTPLLPGTVSASPLERIALVNVMLTDDRDAILRAAEDAVASCPDDPDERSALAAVLDDAERAIYRAASSTAQRLRIGQLTVAVDPRRAPNWAMLAEYLLLGGDGAAGEVAARRALDLGLSSGRVWWIIAEAHQARGEEEDWGVALDEMVGNGLEFVLQAVVPRWAEAERHGDITEVLRRAAERHPDSGDVAVAQGRQEHLFGDRATALAHFERATLLDATNALAHGCLAEAYLEAERLEEAEASFRRAIELAPEDLRARRELATLLVSTERGTEALAVLEGVPEADADPRTQRMRADILTHLGRDEEAVELLVRINGLSPDLGESYGQLGRALLGSSHHSLAVAAFRRAREKDAGDPAWALGEAQARLRAGDAAGTLAVLDASTPPATPASLQLQGLAHGALGDHVRAGELLDQARSIAPSAERHRSAMVAWKLASEYEKALGAAEDWVALDPGSAEAAAARGSSLLDLDRCAEAVAVAEAYLAFDPNDDQCLTVLGIAQQRMGDLAAALQTYRRVTDLRPQYSTAWGNLAEVLILAAGTLGDPDPRWVEGVAALEASVGLEHAAAHAQVLLALVLHGRDPERARALAREAHAKGPRGVVTAVVARVLAGEETARAGLEGVTLQRAGEIAFSQVLRRVGHELEVPPREMWDTLEEMLQRLGPMGGPPPPP